MPKQTLSIALNRDSEEALYRQLITQIRAQIDAGNLPGGARLPASRSARAPAWRQPHQRRQRLRRAARGRLPQRSCAGRGTFVARERGAPESTQPARLAPAANQRAASIRRMMRLARRPGVIDFSGGAPPSEFFPVRYLQDAINHVIERDGADALAYEAPAGYPRCGAPCAIMCAPSASNCRVDDVLITGGAQQAIDLVLQSLMRDGETLVTADPTYLGIIDIAEAAPRPHPRHSHRRRRHPHRRAR